MVVSDNLWLTLSACLAFASALLLTAYHRRKNILWEQPCFHTCTLNKNNAHKLWWHMPHTAPPPPTSDAYAYGSLLYIIILLLLYLLIVSTTMQNYHAQYLMLDWSLCLSSVAKYHLHIRHWALFVHCTDNVRQCVIVDFKNRICENTDIIL